MYEMLVKMYEAILHSVKVTNHSATITMGYLDRLGQPQSQGEMKAG